MLNSYYVFFFLIPFTLISIIQANGNSSCDKSIDRMDKIFKEALFIKQGIKFPSNDKEIDDYCRNGKLFANEAKNFNNCAKPFPRQVVQILGKSLGRTMKSMCKPGKARQEPRRDDGQQHRPVSTASFYQQHYYQPGSSSYSPLTVGASLPDSSRNSSRLGIYDQSSISEPTPMMMTTATTNTPSTFNRSTNYGTLYTSQQKPLTSTSTHQQSSIELPHFDLLSFASSQNSLPKYRDFNSSPRGFFR